MPPGFIPWLANKAVLLMNSISAAFASKIVTYTQDYADHSQFLQTYRHKLKIVSPPVELPSVNMDEIRGYRLKTNPQKKSPVIGMAVRFATEKGVEVILNAMPKILKEFPNAMLQFSGPYKDIRGEEKYIEQLLPRIHELEKSGNWLFLGPQTHGEMALFYPNIDVLILPSLNSTEAFGLVQIEAMISGTPCVASDLPGVRQPVIRHKMGKIMPIGDSEALADTLIQIFNSPENFRHDSNEIRSQYLPKKIAEQYETLFSDLL
jgi:glycosyltransferase involved in cell wall biosynthesis